LVRLHTRSPALGKAFSKYSESGALGQTVKKKGTALLRWQYHGKEKDWATRKEAVYDQQ